MSEGRVGSEQGRVERERGGVGSEYVGGCGVIIGTNVMVVAVLVNECPRGE